MALAPKSRRGLKLRDRWNESSDSREAVGSSSTASRSSGRDRFDVMVFERLVMQAMVAIRYRFSAQRARLPCHSERSEEPALRLWNRGGSEMQVLRDAQDDREPRIRITLFGLARMVAILAICSCAQPAGADVEK